MGYCNHCNKVLLTEPVAAKHFQGEKHVAKAKTFAELVAGEAAVLAGVAAPPERAKIANQCVLCESPCTCEGQVV